MVANFFLITNPVCVCVCRSEAGDGSTKQNVSNVDLLDGLVTTPPQPVGYFTSQPMMAGMPQMYVIGQQPGMVPMMAGNPAGMVQGNSAGVVPNTAAGMMAGFPEGMMQGSSSTVMQMNVGMSVQQQQSMMPGITGPAPAASPMLPSQSVATSSMPVSICVVCVLSRTEFHFYLQASYAV